MVAVVEVLVADGAGAAGAFGDVLPGHFQMHAARDGAFGGVYLKEGTHFLEDLIERPGLVAVNEVMVLPCIGSHDHTTLQPSRLIARTMAGNRSAALSAPTRQSM